MIGARTLRVEDERFLRGEGRFVADLKIPFMLEAVILRSPHAHARIRKIDASAALAREGVSAVTIGDDLPADLPAIPCRIPTHTDMTPFLQHPLARGKVRYVGEPVAVVVARSRAEAEDAAEAVAIEWEILPVVTDEVATRKPDAPKLHDGGNIAGEWGYDIGKVDDALTAAAAKVEDSFSIQRHTAMPLETRGLIAHYDKARNVVEIFGPTKVPHTNRGILAAMLQLPESSLRLAEPDVGGSFGARGEFYPEDFLIPWVAIRLGKPVRWIEDRLEHFMSINHSRQSSFDVKAAADADGKITGIDLRMAADQGAYVRTHGDVVPSHASASFPGPYRLKNYRVNAAAVLTNKTPTGTLRAPGMFEANFVRERVLDRLAKKLKLDPAEFRRRNLLAPAELPWNIGTRSLGRPVILDSGDFPTVFEKTLERAGWTKPLAPNTATVKRGRGVATLAEPSGLGPFEGVRIEIDQNGFVNLIAGSSNQGQGLETMLAQIAAEVLTIPVERIRVRHGDTGLIQYGGGTYASRTAVLGGNAVNTAAITVREKAIRAAAKKLEAAEADLTLTDGRVHLISAPEHGLALKDIARMLMPGNPELLPPSPDALILDNDGLAATSYVRGVPGGTWVFSTHVAEVAVDVETGDIRVERYVVGCDVGRAINPMLVEGQLVGGVVQGLGGALFEELAYDAQGQLTTGSFMDYLLPSVHDAPAMETLVLEQVKSPANTLGVKGVGEVGISGVAAAVGNAAASALDLDFGLTDLPLTPERVRAAINRQGRERTREKAGAA